VGVKLGLSHYDKNTEVFIFGGREVRNAYKMLVGTSEGRPFGLDSRVSGVRPMQTLVNQYSRPSSFMGLRIAEKLLW
jgi:hypothetical protein